MNYHWNLSDNPKLEKRYNDAPELKTVIEKYIAHHICDLWLSDVYFFGCINQKAEAKFVPDIDATRSSIHIYGQILINFLNKETVINATRTILHEIYHAVFHTQLSHRVDLTKLPIFGENRYLDCAFDIALYYGCELMSEYFAEWNVQKHYPRDKRIKVSEAANDMQQILLSADKNKVVLTKEIEAIRSFLYPLSHQLAFIAQNPCDWKLEDSGIDRNLLPILQKFSSLLRSDLGKLREDLLLHHIMQVGQNYFSILSAFGINCFDDYA